MGNAARKVRSRLDDKFRGNPIGRIRTALSVTQLRQMQDGPLMDLFAAALQWAHADVAYLRLIRGEIVGSTTDALAVREWARQELVRYVLEAHREYTAMALSTAVLRATAGAQSAARAERKRLEKIKEPIDLLEHQS